MFCPSCGAQNNDNAEVCIKCGVGLKSADQVLAKKETSSLSMVVPVGRTGLSIVAGYLGLFCIIPVFAPVALIVSLLALKQLKKQPEKLGKGRAIFGLIMGILGTMALLYMILS